MTVWTLVRTDVTSWAEQRAGALGLAVEARRTGKTLCLAGQLLEPAWEENFKQTSTSSKEGEGLCAWSQVVTKSLLVYRWGIGGSRLHLSPRSYSGGSQLDRVWGGCCPWRSSGRLDIRPRLLFALEQPSLIPPDSRSLRGNAFSKRFNLEKARVKLFKLFDWLVTCQAGSRRGRESRLWAVEAGSTAATLRLLR